MTQDTLPVLIVDINTGEWVAHSRFHGIYMKRLLTSTDNPLASVNVVRVPPGGVIGRHHHPAQVETVYVLAGQSILTLDQADMPFNAGQVAAIPMALEHALRNEGSETVELLTFFTPPLT
ncbi:MAG TPA: cupin domain-containing protein [Anaerolineales bacterium]|nr:cupin domain-containing protein [Anaerolineales bacterium]